VQLPDGWAHVLRLDAQPFSASNIGRPPRPHTIALSDAESERVRWQNLVLRHSEDGTQPGGHAISRMMELLQQIQRMEDGLMARCAVETRY
jgi:hypothetical protein